MWHGIILCRRRKMEQKNVPTVILGENIKSFEYYTNHDINYFLVLKLNAINILYFDKEI